MSGRERGAVAGLLLVVGVVACGGEQGALEDPEDLVPQAEVNPLPDAPPVSATLDREAIIRESAFSAEDPNDAPMISGALRVLEPVRDGAAYRLSVRLTGVAEGEHAWHVHEGQCGEAAPVALALSATTDSEGATGPLVADSRGRAEAVVEAPGLAPSWLSAGSHSIRIHEGPSDDPGRTVLCAPL